MTQTTDTFSQIQARIARANGGVDLEAAAADMRELALNGNNGAGHAGAANNYGTLLQFGRGVDLDLACARHYYGLAARTGLAEAQFNLGFMWLNGLGGAQRDKTAFALFTRAANQGDTDALTHIGRMRMLGQGCTQDDEAAFAAWTEGARRGDGRCAFNLGVATAGGHAGAADLVLGLAWFYVAENLRAKGTAAAIAKIKAVLTVNEIASARKTSDTLL